MIKACHHSIFKFIFLSLRYIAVAYHGKNCVLTEHHVVAEHVGVHMGEFIVFYELMYITFRDINQDAVFHQAEFTWSRFGWVTVLEVIPDA
ncbi:MAG TPA: hypothetical protein DCY19_00300 [Eubacterium sp.]|nr:hypothetical protein [Eubacterium sp.]